MQARGSWSEGSHAGAEVGGEKPKLARWLSHTLETPETSALPGYGIVACDL